MRKVIVWRRFSKICSSCVLALLMTFIHVRSSHFVMNWQARARAFRSKAWVVMLETCWCLAVGRVKVGEFLLVYFGDIYWRCLLMLS